MSELAFTVPSELVEAFAALVEERVLERLEANRRDNVSPYLTPVEAAELLRANRQRVYDLLSAGRLHRYKDGARVLVSRAEIEAHLGGNGVAPALPCSSRSRTARGLQR